jgi:hypothetical protein
MPVRDYIGLVLSITVGGAILWACSFEIEQMIMGELIAIPGGRFKFLTILNLVNRFFEISFFYRNI